MAGILSDSPPLQTGAFAGSPPADGMASPLSARLSKLPSVRPILAYGYSDKPWRIMDSQCTAWLRRSRPMTTLITGVGLIGTSFARYALELGSR